MEEIVFTQKEYYDLYAQWRMRLDLFRGTPSDVISEIFELMERLLPIVLTDIQYEYWMKFYEEGISQRQIAIMCSLSSSASISKTLRIAREKVWDVMSEIFPGLKTHDWKSYLIPFGDKYAARRYIEHKGASI